jgi:hypothetical protein
VQEIIASIQRGCYASKELLDAVELAIDSKMPLELLDRLLLEKESIRIIGYDPTGELLGEDYWRDAAGEPRGLDWPTPKEKDRRGNNKSIREEYRRVIPTVVTDRHLGKLTIMDAE